MAERPLPRGPMGNEPAGGVMDAREALARAMRAPHYGTTGPDGWEQASPATRHGWLRNADAVLLHLEKSGYVIARADATKETKR